MNEKETDVTTMSIAGVTLQDVALDRLLRVPVERGFLVGVVGNGQVQLAFRDRAKKRLPFGEDREFNVKYLGMFENWEYYVCRKCGSKVYI